jgi:tetratricopeptide (TPR) repeat protein
MINNDDPRLTSFVLGELDPAEYELIEQAVLASPELAQAVEGIRQLTESLDAAYQLEEPLHLTEGQRAELDEMQKMEQHLGEQPAFSGRSWSPLALAATLLGLLVAGAFLFSDPLENRVALFPAKSIGLEGTESESQDPGSSDGELWYGASEESDQMLPEASVVESPLPALYKMEELAGLDNVDGRELGRGVGFGSRSSGGGGFGEGDIGRSQIRNRRSVPPPSSVPRPNTARQQFLKSLAPLAGEDDSAEGNLGMGLEQDSGGRRVADAGVDEALSDLSLQSEIREENKPLGIKLSETAEPGISTQPIDDLAKDKQKSGELKRQRRTWKRVAASPNTSRLMVGDKTELDLSGMQVNVQVDGFRARVLLDYFYYNDKNQQLEGDFKLRLPDDASLYYFAFGESVYGLNSKGAPLAEEFLESDNDWVSLKADDVRQTRKKHWIRVKESRMVPKEKAAHAFRETVRRKVDPALVEWAGAGVFNARVFPLAPKKLHRIVIGYDVNLKQVGDEWIYDLDLPEQTGKIRLDLKVQTTPKAKYKIEPAMEPEKVENKGSQQLHFRFDEKPGKPIRLLIKKSKETLLSHQGEFWGCQFTPELPATAKVVSSRGIFMLDTSLSSNPDKFNVWLKLLKATLENNRDSLKQFNVLFFDVDGHFFKEEWVDNNSENVRQLMERCGEVALEGATDIYGAIEQVKKAPWLADGADSETIAPDLFLLSDGAATWGETNLRLIGSALATKSLGSLFAYQTGLTGTAIASLRFLTDQTGGAVFSVVNESEIAKASRGHRNRPWKLSGFVVEGATDILTAGRVQWVYPGQSILMVGRGSVGETLHCEFEQAGETHSFSLKPTQVESELASRLYGQVAVGQLESLGDGVFDVSAAYARHFRITGNTCSLLMLETEADYEAFNIKPQEDLFVINTKSADEVVEDAMQQFDSELSEPKAQLEAWLTRLESMPGMSFKMPTALKLALEDIEVTAISEPLETTLETRDSLPKAYLAGLNQSKLNYDVIEKEAERRAVVSIDDAVKVYSSLVESSPGDLVVARDVGYTALQLGRPAQAYHLLRKVALARPFEGSIYLGLGHCLAELGKPDLAIVYYEIALNGEFQRTGSNFKQIVSAEYLHLLRQIESKKLNSSLQRFATARSKTLRDILKFDESDLLITIRWNTDMTDVDLHVHEPSGEECSYQNRRTRSNGQISSDITTGFGPEMYFNVKAPKGKYDVKVNYFAQDANRIEFRSKVYVTVYRNFGRPDELVTRETISLKNVGGKETVSTIGISGK